MLRHIAIIMDGNRRWAQKKGKSKIFGHKQGIKAVKSAIKFAISKNLEVLTLYAFSSENWRRSILEVHALIKLFTYLLDSQLINLNKYNIRLKIIGDIKRFNIFLQKKIIRIEQLTCHNSGLVLNIAINYGGRWDILQAVKNIIEKFKKNKFSSEDEITEDTISKEISMSDQPSVDLVIRTGGECRISNFLLWQISYSELYFTDILWPDFNEKSFQCAIDNFLNRSRRFGAF